MAAPVAVAQTRGLGRSFAGHIVLDDLDLEIRSGELVAMIGRSGTGKSALLRALAGLDRDVTGRVLINATVLGGVPGAAAGAVEAGLGQRQPGPLHQ